MSAPLNALAETMMRDNIDLRTDAEASVAAIMRVSGASQAKVRAAVQSATAKLDREDAADWREMHARAKAGKPIWGTDL